MDELACIYTWLHRLQRPVYIHSVALMIIGYALLYLFFSNNCAALFICSNVVESLIY